jgi:hypothetical protein
MSGYVDNTKLIRTRFAGADEQRHILRQMVKVGRRCSDVLTPCVARATATGANDAEPKARDSVAVTACLVRP